jgi:hypothetical protein
MDKQVDDVLISPIARKNQQGQEIQASDEQTAPGDEGQSEREMSRLQNRRRERDELPVWLL